MGEHFGGHMNSYMLMTTKFGIFFVNMNFKEGSRQGEGLFFKVFFFPNSHDGDSDVVRMFFYGTLKILMATL